MTGEEGDGSDLPPGPERESFLRRTRRRYVVCTWLSRLYMTLVMVMFAALGAESWLAAGVMVALGTGMDLIRNRLAPDLTLDMSQVAAEISAAQTPDPPYPPGKAVTEIYVIFCVLPVYMLALVIADNVAGTGGLNGYLTLFNPLHELASSAMSMTRRHVGQLQGAGLMDRALFVTHLYTIVGVFIVLSTFLISLKMYKFMLFGLKKSKLKGIKTNLTFKQIKKHLITLLVFIIIMDIIFFYITKIKFNDHYMAWRIDISNIPFIMVFILGWVNSITLSFICGCLIRLRANTWQILNGAAITPFRDRN